MSSQADRFEDSPQAQPVPEVPHGVLEPRVMPDLGVGCQGRQA
jgi:hypothetical protein